MTTIVHDLTNMARDALESAKKRRQISILLKKSGMISLGKGAWLGHRSRDIVSGCIIDGSPMDTYITSFILPAFDRHEYITWALGNRMVHCELGGNVYDECAVAIDRYIENCFRVKSASKLTEFILDGNFLSYYSIWATYILLLREFNFDAATIYMDDNKCAKLNAVKRSRLNELSAFVSARDKEGVIRVFEEWGAYSEKIFGPLNSNFDAF